MRSRVLRLVLDTNVLLSALLSPNATSRLVLRQAILRHVVLMSLAQWTEVQSILRRSKFRRYFTDEERRAFLDELDINAGWVAITRFFTVCRDPNDNMILELAVSGQADFIVTGDTDLLALDPFEGIRIVTPRAFLEMP